MKQSHFQHPPPQFLLGLCSRCKQPSHKPRCHLAPRYLVSNALLCPADQKHHGTSAVSATAFVKDRPAGPTLCSRKALRQLGSVLANVKAGRQSSLPLPASLAELKMLMLVQGNLGMLLIPPYPKQDLRERKDCALGSHPIPEAMVWPFAGCAKPSRGSPDPRHPQLGPHEATKLLCGCLDVGFVRFFCCFVLIFLMLHTALMVSLATATGSLALS